MHVIDTVRPTALGALVALLAFLAAACGDDAAETPTEPAPVAAAPGSPAAREPEPTEPPIVIGATSRTYKVILPSKEPETIDEKFVYEHNDVVVYMNWVRAKDAAGLAKALADAYLSGDILGLKDFLDSSMKLAPYVPREDQLTYKAAHPELSQETYVPAEPVFYQADALQNLIPITQSALEGIAFREEEAGGEGERVISEPTLGPIAFQSERGDTSDIYIINADGTNQTQLTNSDEPTKDDRVSSFLVSKKRPYEPAWSHDGTKIAFSAVGGVYVMYLDRSNLEKKCGIAMEAGCIRILKKSTIGVEMDQLAWSPDGTKIAFASDQRPRASRYDYRYNDIYVVNADGTDQTLLTGSLFGHDGAPTWSPDGTRVAFHSQSCGDWGIAVINADGTDEICLPSTGDVDLFPAWSPDGTKIAFQSGRRGTNYDIYVMNTDGSDRIRLTKDPAADSYPSWSPDGSKIAFTSYRTGNGDIYVMDADGSNQTRLTSSRAEDSHPAWSANPTPWAVSPFLDRQLDSLIRAVLGKRLDERITPEELAELTELDAVGEPIADLSGIEQLMNLTKLSVESNQVSDISPLASLTNLTDLRLRSNQVSDISPLANLTSLTNLRLESNQVSDISPLASLTNLTNLLLHSNQISDISPLANLTNLTLLQINHNQVSDISPLADLTNLTDLSLWSNQIRNISPLAKLMNLTNLSLESNQVSDVSPLASLTNLAFLNLESNQVSDISPLANLTNLTALYLRDNPLGDISPLAENIGLGEGDRVRFRRKDLDQREGSEHMKVIQTLEARGVKVTLWQ